MPTLESNRRSLALCCGGRRTFGEPVVRDNLIEALGVVDSIPGEAPGARAAEAQPEYVVDTFLRD